MKYALLPGIIPRFKAFRDSGFGWLAFMMAIVYNSVRLLPNNHPYLNPQNMGQFGIRNVIAEAANNLKICKENIDQIIIFFALLLAMVLLFLQVAGLIFGMVIKPAAALGPFIGLFATPACPSPPVAPGCDDIAFMLLDKVFGVPGLYGSKFDTGIIGMQPFNQALQELFQYYSYAMLVVGAFIFLYYVLLIVGETANTGTPFGRRFNHIYAPLRLVGAIGLLVPLAYGLNSGQYITLLAAKYGSGFATNSWIIFNNELAAVDTPVGTHKAALIARPNPVDIRYLASAISVIRTCKRAYEEKFPPGTPNGKDIRFYLAKNDPGPVAVEAPAYDAALSFFDNKDVVITFGHLYPPPGAGAPPTEHLYVGNVDPLCGQIVVHTNVAGTIAGGPPGDQRDGAWIIQNAFYTILLTLWNHPDIELLAKRATYMHMSPETACDVLGLPGDCKQMPDTNYKETISSAIQTIFNANLALAYDTMIALADNLYDIPPALLNRGWGGAAIWYNHIAEWNGVLHTATINAPTVANMPKIMQKIEEERRAHNEAVSFIDRYDPQIEGFRPVKITDDGGDNPMALAMNEAYKYWIRDGRGGSTETQTSGNVFYDLLNAVFGVGGLFTMRQNDDVHPLAQLSALGKSIIESSIRNLLTALVFSAGGGMGEILGTHLGAALTSISSMFVSFATIGLAIGFILYYVLPFMPFMYFFFAVGGWVKTIFEAMVGVPLWALAHLRVDGNGFPGDSASNGYFLIFEIFIRPILTVFGLIASMAIFSAMARTLNGIFDLVVENLTGFDCSDCKAAAIIGIEYKRNVIDEFFFTIIYTILVYMLATSSFKMIDQIPNSILRWMGAGVQSFGDQRDDPAQGMVQYAAFGGAQLSGQIGGALQQGARAAGQGLGLPVRGLTDALTKRNEVKIGSGPAGNLGKPGGFKGGAPDD
ncbi:MAG: DotA/TraY family protein [Rhodospirillales bacterium]|nr:DotA/TraY family protein [Rhodospirillales bacterium]MCB9996144.1 DotA/TraY family protein [Rhodospirillales bacterium]